MHMYIYKTLQTSLVFGFKNTYVSVRMFPTIIDGQVHSYIWIRRDIQVSSFRKHINIYAADCRYLYFEFYNFFVGVSMSFIFSFICLNHFLFKFINLNLEPCLHYFLISITAIQRDNSNIYITIHTIYYKNQLYNNRGQIIF